MAAVRIDAKDLHYTPLNQQIRAAVAEGAKEIVIDNVLGQRFIGDGLRGDGVTITVNGVPGGDLAMFMSGPTIIVNGNATMHRATPWTRERSSSMGAPVTPSPTACGAAGLCPGQHRLPGRHPYETIPGETPDPRCRRIGPGIPRRIHGRRTPHCPWLNSITPVSERGIGSGIHGGEIIIRGTVDEKNLGVGAKQQPITSKEREAIMPIIMDFAQVFGIDSGLLSHGYIHADHPVKCTAVCQQIYLGVRTMAQKSYVDLKSEVWDTGKCSGCGACVAVCPADALSFAEGEMITSPSRLRVLQTGNRQCPVRGML